MAGKLIIHITIPVGRERQDWCLDLPRATRRGFTTGGFGDGGKRVRRSRHGRTRLPIDRPSVIEDQSLPFCEVLSVTGIELKPRPEEQL